MTMRRIVNPVLCFVAAWGGGSSATAQVAPAFHGQATMSTVDTFECAVGDVDGDGRTDLVVYDGPATSTKRRIRVDLGNGFGRFEPGDLGFELPGTFLTHKLTALTSADLNGDGRAEILFSFSPAPNAQTSIEVLTLVPGSGLAPFDSILVPPGVSITELHASDIDRDGDVDLVFATSNSSHGILVAQQASGGFSPSAMSVSPLTTAIAITVRDVNADGWPDLVAVGSPLLEDARVLLGGVAGFSAGPATKLDQGGYPPNSVGPKSVAAGDFDGDGHIDLVVATAQLGGTRYAGDGLGKFTFAQHFGALSGSTARVVDVDGDGFLDAVIGGSQAICFARNDGLGTLTPTTAQPIPTAASRVLDCALDGDDRVDFVIAGSAKLGTRTFLGTETGTIAMPRGPLSPHLLAIAGDAADIDADGDVDYVRHSLALSEFRVDLNDGDANFGTHVSTAAPPQVYQLILRDLGGDGLPELIVVPFGTNTIEVRPNLGGGQFGAAQATTAPASVGLLDVFAADDFDGDGDVDLAAASAIAGAGLAVFVNVGGNLVVGQACALPAGFKVSDLDVADLTGDGIFDLVAIEQVADSRVHVVAGLGGGSFAVTGFDVPTSFVVRDLATGDLDHDSVRDLVLGVEGAFLQPDGQLVAQNAVRAYTLGPGGSWHLAAHLVVPTPCHGIVVADADGDAHPDLVTKHSRLLVAHGDGTGAMTPFEDFDANANINGFAVANFDADPEIEIAYHHYAGSNVELLDAICPGRAGRFGHGCAGTGARVPRLSLGGCFRDGETIDLGIHDAVGGSIAILLKGLAPAPAAFNAGCVIQIAPLLPSFHVLPLFGTPGGVGSFEASVALPPGVVPPGVRFTLQAVCADPALPWGYTVTQGLDVLSG
ncbi:MAG: VCBS repeat-containing protein [Planctomycetes bacterium]|nr:VCBS repeat-containing protein [Planctomycetota bacterium]